MSMPLSLCCLHIKLHLTSISVKETGAAGSCPSTTQDLLPPFLPYPAIPPVSYSLQGPFSHLPHPRGPFTSAPSFWQNVSFLHESVTPRFMSQPVALLSHYMPFLCSFSEALIYALLKRLHTTDWINTKYCKTGETITNIWRVFKGVFTMLFLPLNKLLLYCERVTSTADSTENLHPAMQYCAAFSYFSAQVKTIFTYNYGKLQSAQEII